MTWRANPDLGSESLTYDIETVWVVPPQTDEEREQLERDRAHATRVVAQVARTPQEAADVLLMLGLAEPNQINPIYLPKDEQ